SAPPRALRSFPTRRSSDLGSFLVLGLIGPAIAPYDYLAQDLTHTSAPPFAAHWLGTDNVGRDLLSRVLWGYQTALVANGGADVRSEEHTSELQSLRHLVCR